MIEVDDSTSADELVALAPDVTVWGEVDPVDAALLVLNLAAA